MHLTQIEVDSILNVKVARLFEKWIHRLRLRDWDVSWSVVRKSGLPDDRSGACDSLLTKKMARIRVLHPDDADPSWWSGYDIELTIVHELLHLHFAPWAMLSCEDDQAVLFLEQTVHALSTAYVEAERGDRHWANFPELCSVQDPGSMVR